MDGADAKMLRLKIKMRGVVKPPMWREVLVPADFNFSQLHYVIQAVAGLLDGHLWQFQYRPYGNELAIGIPQAKSESGFGLDSCTHDADETPVTAFLAPKGDKVVYVYDLRKTWLSRSTSWKCSTGRERWPNAPNENRSCRP